MTTFGWILLGLCIVLVILFGVRILSDLMWNNRLKHFQRRNHVFFPKVTQLFWFKRVYGFTVVILLTFAVLATGAFEINNMMGERKLLNAIPVSSEQNLKQIIKNANSQSWLESIFSFFPSGARNDDAIDFLEAESQVTAKDIIGTNLQKEGVDEADVIKTDGDMVYYAPRYDNSIRIFYVQMDKTLDLIGNLNLENLYTDALYLTSDYLIVVGYTYETINYQVESGFYSYGWNWSYTGAVRIYDRATLEVTHELQTDGMFYEHRVIGDAMYLVSQKSVYDDEPRPMFQKTDGDSTVTSYLDFDDIYYFNNMHISSMTVVTALNLSTFESQSQAFLGGVSH
ncbi:MAG: beta-propeller domain-containing protein, partial [Acholeplasmataceae bacterium]|nr:beta-propeller domain-containing protein [Acholeplasmataceae bacterium]